MNFYIQSWIWWLLLFFFFSNLLWTISFCSWQSSIISQQKTKQKQNQDFKHFFARLTIKGALGGDKCGTAEILCKTVHSLKKKGEFIECARPNEDCHRQSATSMFEAHIVQNGCCTLQSLTPLQHFHPAVVYSATQLSSNSYETALGSYLFLFSLAHIGPLCCFCCRRVLC